MSRRRPFHPLHLLFLALSCPFVAVSAQGSPTISVNVSTILTTSTAFATTVSRSGSLTIPVFTPVPTAFNVTVTSTPTPTPTPIVLATKLDPAFGVLGALLVLTGLPSAFWGHKNRWTSFFLIGFYTLSLVCLVLILKFGVLPAVNPPSKTLRGMFVLSCTIAGIAGGGIAIFFWKGAKYFIGAWGGFALALWIQCFRNGGLIDPIGLRWILYIGCGVLGFVLCTIPRWHYHALLASTAFVGATSFILGVDCFTTAGLKEFYIWNIGFPNMFPTFTENRISYPVSQTMQIELGLMGAVALMGIAVQLRILRILQRKLGEISEEQRRRDEEAALDSVDRFAGVTKEKEQWEKDHPGHTRKASGLSTVPLIGYDDPSSQGSEDLEHHRHSGFTLVSAGHRPVSGLDDYLRPTTPADDLPRAGADGKRSQSPGALPVLDLGVGIQDDVPRNFIAEERPQKLQQSSQASRPKTKAELEDIRKKEELLAEIQTIRRSIDALKSESSSSEGSRHPSLTSRRTLSHDTSSLFLPATHLRPGKQNDSRTRVQSMELSALTQQHMGASIGRSSSAPLHDDDWDSYVRDRKLLQPPSGITAPIATTSINPKLAIPAAITEALAQRKRRESAIQLGLGRSISRSGLDYQSEDIPLARMGHTRGLSSGTAQISILPPRRAPVPIVAPVPQRPRTRTFEELAERHREKMRDLQTPLTQAEKEQADLLAAKSRWDRSKATEKDAVNRRLAEKAAAFTKEAERRRSEGGLGKPSRRSMTLNDAARPAHQHSRSLSADKLAALTGPAASSKRMSTMKVEDWQKYQQETAPERPAQSASRLDASRIKAQGPPVPFPDPARGRNPSAGYIRQNRLSNATFDPPN